MFHHVSTSDRGMTLPKKVAARGLKHLAFLQTQAALATEVTMAVLF
jgi:hypothetical protein